MNYFLFLRGFAALLLSLGAAGAPAQGVSPAPSPQLIKKYKVKTTAGTHVATHAAADTAVHKAQRKVRTGTLPPMPTRPPRPHSVPMAGPPAAGHLNPPGDKVPYSASISLPAKAKTKDGFPWPPRPYSEQVDLPQDFFDGVQTLGEADDHLSRVLIQASYRDFRYYVLPEQPGFALVTKFEQIRETYVPLPEPDRWSLDTTPCPGFSPLCLARSLVFPTSGYWRVFVFVVTDRPLPDTEGTAPTSAEGELWFGAGTNKLPAAVRRLPFTPDHYAAVLVYEFDKQEGQPVVLVPRCRRDGFTQLRLVGIRY